MPSAAFELTTVAGLVAMSLAMFLAGAFAWVVPDFLTYIGRMPDPSPFTRWCSSRGCSRARTS
ncbi:hypothetical protein ACFQRB_14085 [Halobaculum litoreum]|uniref:Uncharacterized protein n=1 Tax=Halobaculum litoreum TaxID=3031998 RepID=A0ABD5XVQ6_9EURY